MLAVALGRPLGIEGIFVTFITLNHVIHLIVPSDIDSDVELPLAIDDDDIHAYFEHEGNVRENGLSLMTGFIALINLTKKAGLILRTVYGLNNCKVRQPACIVWYGTLTLLQEDMTADELNAVQAAIDMFDAELTKWCTELPPAFKSNPVGPKQVTMVGCRITTLRVDTHALRSPQGAVLCSSYYAILITLHRKVMPTRTAQGNMTSTSFAKAVAAARSCIMLAPSIKDAIPSSHHLSFFIQYLFSSAVIILLCVINSNPDETAVQTVMNEVGTCIHALATQEGRWPGAQRCKILLGEDFCLCGDMEVLGKLTRRNRGVGARDEPSTRERSNQAAACENGAYDAFHVG